MLASHLYLARAPATPRDFGGGGRDVIDANNQQTSSRSYHHRQFEATSKQGPTETLPRGSRGKELSDANEEGFNQRSTNQHGNVITREEKLGVKKKSKFSSKIRSIFVIECAS